MPDRCRVDAQGLQVLRDGLGATLGEPQIGWTPPLRCCVVVAETFSGYS